MKEAKMRWSFQIAKFFGIPIKVHITFFLLLIFIGFYGSRIQGARSGLFGIASIILIFLCVVIHEFAHSLVARKYGVKIRDIILLPIGGVSEMEELPSQPKQEINVALVGPLTSIVLSLIFFLAYRLLFPEASTVNISIFQGNLLLNLFAINLMLGLFNLLPAFPMDGGRVLRGLLGLRMDLLRATRIAVGIGEFLAILFFFIGLFFNPWLALIAVFIFLGAEGEKRATELKVEISDVPVRVAMLTNVEPISPDNTLGEILDRMCHGLQQDFPVMEGKEFLGFLSRERFFSALRNHPRETRVREILSRDYTSTTEDASLSEVFQRMNSEKISVLPVMQGQVFKGLISLEQIGKYHMLCGLRK
jgi:Zn-dependent protease/predicted transcriptional regulator